MIKHLSVMVIIYFLSSVCLFADRPPEWEGWHYTSKEKSTSKDTTLVLLPDFDERNELIQSVQLNSPEMSLEMLYEMPLPDINGEELFLFLFNRLNSFSSMKGIKYYSANKDRMTLYLEDCFLVLKKGKKTPLENPVYSELPEEINFVIYQKDTTFGSNWYNVTTKVSEDVIWLSMTNISTMKYLFFPIMGKGDIKIDIIIVPEENSIKLYTLSQLKKAVSKVLGKKIYLPGVFDHRVSAIQGWFAQQIYSNPFPGQIQ
jgi:uncharacterized protein DUF6675